MDKLVDRSATVDLLALDIGTVMDNGFRFDMLRCDMRHNDKSKGEQGYYGACPMFPNNGVAPVVVALGSSHWHMWGKILEDLAVDTAMLMAFCCQNGRHAIFSAPPSALDKRIFSPSWPGTDSLSLVLEKTAVYCEQISSSFSFFTPPPP
jgi:hypothetical protein